MHRIFPHQRPPRRPQHAIRLFAAGNEVACFQIGLSGVPDQVQTVQVHVEAFRSANGAEIPKRRIEVFSQEYVPARWHIGLKDADIYNYPPARLRNARESSPVFTPTRFIPPRRSFADIQKHRGSRPL